VRAYIWHIFISLTQLLNTLLGGYPDESTSSRLWRLHLKGEPAGTVLAALVDALFFWQEDHCRRAYESERTRYHLPPILR
jgi:hypothetical protein